MSARPERKRSTLSGRNPIAPAAETPQEPPAVAPAPATPATPAESATEPQAAAPRKRSKYPPKVSFYQEQDDTDRIRGAIMHTIPYEGVRSLSQFLSGAAMKEVERLERQYNDGKPFPPVGARELPQGRPMGE
jgi:hypothetical protein